MAVNTLKKIFWVLLGVMIAFQAGASAWADEAVADIRCDSDEEGPYLGYIYQEKNYSLEDVAGDLCLLKRVDGAQKKLVWTLTRKAARTEAYRQKILAQMNLHPETLTSLDALNPLVEPAAPADLVPIETLTGLDLPHDDLAELLAEEENRKLSIEGRDNPIRVKAFVEMLAEVISEETASGLPARVGSPHRWSQEIRRSVGGRFKTTLRFSKLLVALSQGVTSRYMVTGREEALASWIAAQKDESVTWDRLFRKSYQAADGDVYLALLTAENVLSRFWGDPGRDHRLLTTKLTRMINHHGPGEDRFGAWYHLVGLMLYGYVEGGTRAALVGTVETLGSHVLSGFEPEMQEDHINSVGGRIGADLRRIVENGIDPKRAPDPSLLDQSRYLDLNEDFRDRIRVVSNPAFKAVLEPGQVRLTSKDRALTGCTAEIMINSGQGFDSRNKIVQRNVKLKKGRATLLNIPDQNPREARIFLNDCTVAP